eukprot:COSAG05_NODE_2625_length_2828_cov_2.465005_1_plen_100_part_00
MVSAFRSKILTTDSPAPPSGTAPVVGGGVDICGDVSAFDCVVGERGIDESISVTFGRVLSLKMAAVPVLSDRPLTQVINIEVNREQRKTERSINPPNTD